MSQNNDILLIKKYLSGKLSKKDEVFFNERIKDPFFAEAVEGFRSNPKGMVSHNKARNKVKKSLKLSSTFFIFPVISVLLSITLVLYFLNTGFVKNGHKTEAASQPNVEIKSKSITKVAEQNNRRDVKEVTKMPEKIEESFIRPNQYLKVKPSVENIEPIQNKKVAGSVDAETVEEDFTKHLFSNNFKISYFHDYKVADYRYKRTIKKKEEHLTGVNAQYENEPVDFTNKAFSLDNEPVTYWDYLNVCINEVSKLNNSKAILMLNNISDVFPEDINASFYKGLCLYRAGNYEQAIIYFKKTREHYINIFNREALWYSALTYQKTNNIKQAKQIFEKIVSEKGFYASKAEDMLKKID